MNANAITQMKTSRAYIGLFDYFSLVCVKDLIRRVVEGSFRLYFGFFLGVVGG